MVLQINNANNKHLETETSVQNLCFLFKKKKKKKQQKSVQMTQLTTYHKSVIVFFNPLCALVGTCGTGLLAYRLEES